jgi:hypothetical protein
MAEDGASPPPDEPGPKPSANKRASKANATYTEMITAAIIDLNDRTGSSTPAITSWIASHYPKLKVKNTTVGGKIRPLVQSGYLVRAKSSFKLSAATRESLRKAKAAKANKKKEGAGGGSGAGGAKKDRGLDQISRVRKHLGLLPLVSNHHIFDDLTQIIAAHAVTPLTRDALSADRPKKKRRTGGGKKSQAAGNVDPAAVAAAMQSGTAAGGANASMMRGSARAKSAYNFYQDTIKATIRKEQPGISMPDLRKGMMARWNAMAAEEKKPYEAQGAVAREVFNQMQTANKTTAAAAAAAAAATETAAAAAPAPAAVSTSAGSSAQATTTVVSPLQASSTLGAGEMAPARSNGSAGIAIGGSSGPLASADSAALLDEPSGDLGPLEPTGGGPDISTGEEEAAGLSGRISPQHTVGATGSELSGMAAGLGDSLGGQEDGASMLGGE